MNNRRLRDNALERVTALMRCRCCTRIMLLVLAVGDEYYCRPCIEELRRLDPVQFADVTIRQFMTRSLWKFYPLLDSSQLANPFTGDPSEEGIRVRDNDIRILKLNICELMENGPEDKPISLPNFDQLMIEAAHSYQPPLVPDVEENIAVQNLVIEESDSDDDQYVAVPRRDAGEIAKIIAIENHLNIDGPNPVDEEEEEEEEEEEQYYIEDPTANIGGLGLHLGRIGPFPVEEPPVDVFALANRDEDEPVQDFAIAGPSRDLGQAGPSRGVGGLGQDFAIAGPSRDLGQAGPSRDLGQAGPSRAVGGLGQDFARAGPSRDLGGLGRHLDLGQAGPSREEPENPPERHMGGRQGLDFAIAGPSRGVGGLARHLGLTGPRWNERGLGQDHVSAGPSRAVGGLGQSLAIAGPSRAVGGLDRNLAQAGPSREEPEHPLDRFERDMREKIRINGPGYVNPFLNLSRAGPSRDVEEPSPSPSVPKKPEAGSSQNGRGSRAKKSQEESTGVKRKNRENTTNSKRGRGRGSGRGSGRGRGRGRKTN